MWIQLVPHLPVEPDGLGQYALALDEAWSAARRHPGEAPRPPEIGILTATPNDEPAIPASGALSRLEHQSAPALVAALEHASAILVHYVGYGYQRRGCPTWLIEGLERLRRGPRPPRLVTWFHEIYASGPPWTSSFWLAGTQRRLATRLLRLSDAAITSMPLYAQVLAELAPGTRVTQLPLLSTVGEPEQLPDFTSRPERLVVFGSEGVRRRAWVEHAPDLHRAIEALRPRSLVDIGPGSPAPDRFAGLPVERRGVLPAAAVSAELLDARYAFMAYPGGFLPKSTIFASFAAHGLCAVRAWRGHSPADSRFERGLCWEVSHTPLPGSPERLAAFAFGWYRHHDRAAHAARLGALLATTPQRGPD